LPLIWGQSLGNGSLLYAVEGEGSFQRGCTEEDTKEYPIKISNKQDSLIMAESPSHSNNILTEWAKKIGVVDTIKVDSQAKYALLARGDCDLYLRFTKREYREYIWDHAAGYEKKKINKF
jgi:3'-phosphoadenosine 5'-phosphosulfate (PAPS) 3'-phosphatase